MTTQYCEILRLFFHAGSFCVCILLQSLLSYIPFLTLLDLYNFGNWSYIQIVFQFSSLISIKISFPKENLVAYPLQTYDLKRRHTSHYNLYIVITSQMKFKYSNISLYDLPLYVCIHTPITYFYITFTCRLHVTTHSTFPLLNVLHNCIMYPYYQNKC